MGQVAPSMDAHAPSLVWSFRGALTVLPLPPWGQAEHAYLESLSRQGYSQAPYSPSGERDTVAVCGTAPLPQLPPSSRSSRPRVTQLVGSRPAFPPPWACDSGAGSAQEATKSPALLCPWETSGQQNGNSLGGSGRMRAGAWGASPGPSAQCPATSSLTGPLKALAPPRPWLVLCIGSHGCGLPAARTPSPFCVCMGGFLGTTGALAK